MPIALFLISLMIATTMMLVSSSALNSKKLMRENGSINSQTGTFVDERGKTFPFIQTNYNSNDRLNDTESVETALVRTCRSVSTLAKINGCSLWNQASYVWGFAGIYQGSGSLDGAFTGTTSGVFNCATADRFGRGLLQNSLPSSFIVGQGFLYDFTGMDNRNVDPCGYLDIVRR